jgi:hypothetical protein
VSGTEELFLRLYYNSSHNRDYLFNVTFTPNTKPYFATPITELVINWGADQNFTLPTATDDDSDAFSYYFNKIDPTAAYTVAFDSVSNTKWIFTDLQWPYQGRYTDNELHVRQHNSNDMFYSIMNFDVVLNDLPYVSETTLH